MLNLNLYEKISKDIKMYYRDIDNIKRNKWRNDFHIEMPFGLINDPNGLSYFNDKFYIFFQWNPFGCEHKSKHWGLVTTKDFINFTMPKIVLKPNEWFDKDGCYSGGAYVKDGILKLFYTGNVKDNKDGRKSYQCLVDYNKDGSYEKKGVLIETQPKGYTSHFRDPVIFKEDRIYYMVLGSQTDELKGRALIYKSENMNYWTLAGELKTDMNDFGYMWECPNLFRISDDKFAFMFSPQGLKEEGFKYQNIYQSGYVIGDLNLNEISLEKHSEFKEIDKGFDFYAPQVFNYKGKNIMVGWVGMPDKEDEYLSSEYGWMFGLSMPRVLNYKDNILYQEPFDFLKNLRQSKIIELENKVVENYSIILNTKAIEIELDIDVNNIDNIELNLNFKDEKIAIIYNKREEICILDRSNMKLGGKGIRKFKLKVDKSIRLHMFIDNSVIEIYYQDGLETTTCVYFPKSNEFDMKINSNIKINRLEIWKLRRIDYEG